LCAGPEFWLLFELVATSEKTDDGWRRQLHDGQTVRIGRAPKQGWRISWDPRISREHVDVTLRGARLEVEVVEAAKNPAVFNGLKLRQLSVGSGEEFTIGRTRFCLEPIAGSAPKPTTAPSITDSAAALHEEIARLKARRQIKDATDSPPAAQPAPVVKPVSPLACSQAPPLAPPQAPTDDADAELHQLRERLEEIKRRRAASLASQPAASSSVDAEDAPAGGSLQQKLAKLKSELDALAGKSQANAAEPPLDKNLPAASIATDAGPDASSDISPDIASDIAPDDAPDATPVEAAPGSVQEQPGGVIGLFDDDDDSDFFRNDPAPAGDKPPRDAALASADDWEESDNKKTALPEDATELKQQLIELQRRREAESATDSEKLTESQYDYVHRLLLQLHQVERHAAETDSVEIAQETIKGLQSRIAEAADKIAGIEGNSTDDTRDIASSQQRGYGSSEIRERAAEHRNRLEQAGGELSASDQLTGSEAEILEKLETGRHDPPPESAAENAEAVNATMADIPFTQKMAAAALNPDEVSPLLADIKPKSTGKLPALPLEQEDSEAASPVAGKTPQTPLLSLLPEDVQDRVLAIAAGEAASQQDQQRIAAALTAALSRTKDGGDDAPPALPPLEQLAAMHPQLITKRTSSSGDSGASRQYYRRGEWFGVAAMLKGEPYRAALRGYDPPSTGSVLTSSPAFVVRLPREAVQGLKLSPPAVNRAQPSAAPWLQPLPPALKQDLSAKQAKWDTAQNLLLIDLDLCTRCGECVDACGEVHADGLSRLTLQGPTTGKQWAVQSCRACVDAECLAGCPVNAIGQLNGSGIDIAEWCIGCGLCEQQCPYDAIHIYDNAILSPTTTEWAVAPLGAAPGSRWRQPGFDDSHWLRAPGPFFWNKQLREELAAQWPEPPTGGLTPKLCFRAKFAVGVQDRLQKQTLKIRTSRDMQIWLNGELLPLVGREIHGEGFPLLWETGISSKQLIEGDNLCSVLVPFGNDGDPLLWAQIAASPKNSSNQPAQAALMAPPAQTAVVCDLCHQRKDGPACIEKCPETALFRFDGTGSGILPVNSG